MPFWSQDLYDLGKVLSYSFLQNTYFKTYLEILNISISTSPEKYFGVMENLPVHAEITQKFLVEKLF
jgi:hypothetical protein